MEGPQGGAASWGERVPRSVGPDGSYYFRHREGQ
jgi:hypothetical protein